jgi:hypothetical protein
MGKMIDTPYAYNLSQKIASPSFSGIEAVGLYYFEESDYKQRLTRSVAQAVSAAQKYIVSLWENGRPESASYFSADKGKYDSQLVIPQAIAAGQPTHTPIYATVDYDASESDLGVILPYMAAFQVALKSVGYLAGIYGSGLVCRAAYLAGYVSFTWESGSRGWAGYDDWKNHAQIVQGGSSTVEGIAFDFDTTNGAAGGWKIAV